MEAARPRLVQPLRPVLPLLLWLGASSSKATKVEGAGVDGAHRGGCPGGLRSCHPFNRQKQRTADEGSDALELIWVPILLIHLGGQSSSAYSLEDNELWKRHAITLVS